MLCIGNIIMKKSILIIYSILYFSHFGYAQSWDHIYPSSNNEHVESIAEISNNRYLIVGYNRLPNNQYGGRIIIVNDSGITEMDTSYYETGYSQFFDNILLTEDKILIIGQKTIQANINTCTDSVFIKIFDFNLNLLEEHLYFFSDSLQRSFSKSIFDHQKNIIITGYGGDINSVRRPYLWKIDTNYTISAKNDTMFHSWLSSFGSTIDFIQDSSYYVFTMGLSNDYADMIIRFDYNLNYISMDSTKQELGLPNHPIMYRTNEIMHVGKNRTIYSQVHDYGIIVLDSAFNNKWFKQYRVPDTNQVPAVFESISKYENNVYIGAIFNSDYYYSEDTTWYQLTKMDTNYNILWEKRFLGYANDMLTNVLATSDGGCLMAGWAHIGSQPYNIHLVKIDSMGTATWVQDIKLPETAISIYPNPCSKELNLKLSEGNKYIVEYSIFDIQAKLLLKKQLNATKAKIDIQNLANGVYIIEARTNQGKVYRSKFVKK